MSQRINKYKHHLKFLSECESKHCTHLLKNANGDLIKCICECALNVLCGNIPLDTSQKNNLQKYKHQLRSLTSRKNITQKKKIIQKGTGLLPFLLAPVITALGSTLFK